MEFERENVRFLEIQPASGVSVPSSSVYVIGQVGRRSVFATSFNSAMHHTEKVTRTLNRCLDRLASNRACVSSK